MLKDKCVKASNLTLLSIVNTNINTKLTIYFEVFEVWSLLLIIFGIRLLILFVLVIKFIFKKYIDRRLEI